MHLPFFPVDNRRRSQEGPQAELPDVGGGGAEPGAGEVPLLRPPHPLLPACQRVGGRGNPTGRQCDGRSGGQGGRGYRGCGHFHQPGQDPAPWVC